MAALLNLDLAAAAATPASKATRARAASSPMHTKTLGSLAVEIERALDEDDAALAAKLQQQYDELAESGTTQRPPPCQPVSPVGEAPAPVEAGAAEPPDAHCNRVWPGLWVGDLTAATEPARLLAAGITHVVDLANTIDSQSHVYGNRNVHYVVNAADGDWQQSCPNVVAKMVVRVDDVDDAPLADHFDAINAFVDAGRSSSTGGGGQVLVHCFRGKSRSATAVVQYLMQREGFTLKAALDRTSAARPAVQLNVGFRKQLMALERRLRPDEPPSVILKLKSNKPVLSSSRPKSRPKARGAPLLAAGSEGGAGGVKTEGGGVEAVAEGAAAAASFAMADLTLGSEIAASDS